MTEHSSPAEAAAHGQIFTPYAVDESGESAGFAALPTPPPESHVVPAELQDLTFAIQHNPRCPSPWLVRLVGKSGTIDMMPYGDPIGFVKHQTTDRLGFGKTLEEAARAALATTEGQL